MHMLRVKSFLTKQGKDCFGESHEYQEEPNFNAVFRILCGCLPCVKMFEN